MSVRLSWTMIGPSVVVVRNVRKKRRRARP
jgi:hypothetical protein